ncbi:acyltransferase family protein [Sphingomonas alba]|uniref:Acyltransferase n=1 Tax=Sphingomonas alba TaxID=2908208 RepID=A0ABT0RJA8_9SPHN|nr:acyltransferase family protein [Sphingomonas alba]MCL6682704.1 acyltransferase [Sphingomonas alba]
MQQPSYRPDIDGLRAFAVLAVIFYHFGLSGFSGGYVGVDVFFVISGFLITQILVREHELGRYSIVKFYERRVRRIIPALLVLLALTLAAGWIFLAPAEYSDLGKSTLSALGFVSNIKFWRGSGYFDQAAVRPILHTWSLAVEEQFYIFYPLLLALLYRLGKRWIGPVILTGLAVSLLLSAAGVFLSPSATFFLIPTRAWELMVGAVLALGLVPGIARRGAAEILAIVGTIMLAASVLLYDQRTFFPGLAALLPCLGTALLIHSGSGQETRVKALLSWRPIVVVGLMSYSLYLYHFPIHIYAVRLLSRELTPTDAAIGIALTFVLAFLSWRYVERPFRQRDRFTRRQIFAFGALGSLAVAIPAAAVVATTGAIQRFSEADRQMVSAASDFSPDGLSCINMDVRTAMRASQCHVGDGTNAERGTGDDLLVVGDSHAAAILPAARSAAQSLRLSGTILAYNSCAPLLGAAAPALSWKDAKGCADRNREWVRIVQHSNIGTVVLAGYWSSHLQSWDKYEGDGGRHMARALNRTMDALAGKRIVILLDVPHARQPIWIDAIFARRFGRPNQKLISGGDDEAAQIIRRVAAGRAEVIDLSAPFCTAGQCALFDRQGRPILTDSNHVTASVSREVLAPLLYAGLAAQPPVTSSK